MTNTYTYKPLLRQSTKQRQSSELVERKWNNRNPLSETYHLKQNSEYSQSVMMNRQMMKTANFNNENTLRDYVLTVWEVPKQQQMYG